MDNTRVIRDSFGWVPLFRALKQSSDFRRYCVEDDVDRYVNHLRKQVIGRDKGQFFYVVNGTTKTFLAVTAISLKDGVLHVHFFWAKKYGPEEEMYIKKVFDVACNYFGLYNIKHVLFPVPIEAIGSWDGYGVRISDPQERKLIWYKFMLKDFCSFSQYLLQRGGSRFVA